MIEIGRVYGNRPYLLADTIEIMLAFDEYETVSEHDLLGLLNNSIIPCEELISDDEIDLDEDNYPDRDGNIPIGADKDKKIEDAFRQIEYRKNTLNESYPFEIKGEIVRLRKNLNLIQKIYIFLLASSRTRTFKGKGVRQLIADGFENISRECLKHILSKTAIIYMFGPKTSDRRDTFGTDLRKALPILAEKMGISLSSKWEKSIKSSSGDAQIDLIGINNFFDDDAGDYKVSIVQCAARELDEEWRKKRYEADYHYKKGIFDFSTPPEGMLFVPACYRHADGSWVNPSNISGITFLDRIRIMKTLVHAQDSISFDVDDIFKSARIYELCKSLTGK